MRRTIFKGRTPNNQWISLKAEYLFFRYVKLYLNTVSVKIKGVCEVLKKEVIMLPAICFIFRWRNPYPLLPNKETEQTQNQPIRLQSGTLWDWISIRLMVFIISILKTKKFTLLICFKMEFPVWTFSNWIINLSTTCTSEGNRSYLWKTLFLMHDTLKVETVDKYHVNGRLQ